MNKLYLSHHGIKGQKWGIKNGPPYPLDYAQSSASERKDDFKESAWVKRTKSQRIHLISGQHRLTPKRATVYIKKSLSSDKIKNIEQAVIDKYKDRVLFKKSNTGEDFNLGKDTVYRRLQIEKLFESYPFYATVIKDDINKYQGLFGYKLKKNVAKELNIPTSQATVYSLGLKNKTSTKIAGIKNATKIHEELTKNRDYATKLHDSLLYARDTRENFNRPGQIRLLNNALRILDKDPVVRTDKEKQTLYAATNLLLVQPRETDRQLQKTFYNALQNKGYDGIVDLNDKKYSSYHAKMPVIIFNTKNIKTDSTTELKGYDPLTSKYTKIRARDIALYDTIKSPIEIFLNKPYRETFKYVKKG